MLFKTLKDKKHYSLNFAQEHARISVFGRTICSSKLTIFFEFAERVCFSEQKMSKMLNYKVILRIYSMVITSHHITFIYPWIFRVAYAANISEHLTII